ncbi:MAG: hypothetical protein HZA62_06660 [Rhodocyclales bacterium]|nr:hypothetical protein [Rhodocyclales bacterium]
MFHVLDHTDLVYSGDLSQATQYILDHSGKRLDEAIRSGIRILYSDALHSLTLGRHPAARAAYMRPAAEQTKPGAGHGHREPGATGSR